jgi:hypothetical protein
MFALEITGPAARVDCSGDRAELLFHSAGADAINIDYQLRIKGTA